MKTKSLFGVQFVKSPRYKAEVLQNFEFWKQEKQRLYYSQSVSLLKYITANMIDLNRGNYDPKGKPDAKTRQEANEEVERGLKNGSYDLGDRLFNFCNFEKHEIELLVDEKDCRHFYIASSVLVESEKLNTKEPYDLAWLRPTADGKRQLNFGNKFLRYQKIGSKILALSGAFTPRQDGLCFFEYTFFNFDLEKKTETGHILRDDERDYYNEISSKDFDGISRKLLFQLIVFMELAPIEEINLPAGHRHGNKKSEVFLINEETFPMIIVNKNWNRNIHIGQIDVSAHYRLQPCGPGSVYRELIYICDHYRNGYNISAGKLKSA